MVRWAEVCYAFLSDVWAAEDPRKLRSDFRMSRWFERGWTLQELIAPGVVHFYDRYWNFIGCREKLLDVIVQVTKISPTYFATGDLSQFSAAQKLSWAARRNTTRPEYIAYCLLELFDINMPLLYGEGERAFQRLQEEILRQSEDDSLFCHDGTEMLAISPLYFLDASKVLKGETWPYKNNPGLVLDRNLSLNRKRISISFPVAQVLPHEFFKFYALNPTLPPQRFLGLQPQNSVHLALLSCGMSESASVLVLREGPPGVFVKQGVPCSPIAQAASDPKLAERFVTNPSTGTWSWKARNHAFAAERMLGGQMQVHFQNQEPIMTPIIRPAISYNRSDRGLVGALSAPLNDALDKFWDKVVVRGPCRDTAGFQCQFVHVDGFLLSRVEHGDEIHFIPYDGGAKGQLWLIFSSSTEESFMVTLKPTRASANAQLCMNIHEWKRKLTIEYIYGFEKQSETGNKLSCYTEPQRLSSENDAPSPSPTRQPKTDEWLVGLYYGYPDLRKQ